MTFYEYVRSLSNLQLYHDYRLGHARDISGNSNHGSLVATSKWTRGPKGHQLDPSTAGGITVADVAALRPDGAHSVVIFMQPFETEGKVGGRLWSVSTAAVGNAPDLYIPTATQVGYYDVIGNDRRLTIDWAGLDQFVVTVAGSGQTPKGYRNGVLVGSFGGAVTLSPNAAAHTIANYPTLVAPLGKAVRGALIFDRALSSSEIGTMRELWNAQPEIGGQAGRGGGLWQVKADLLATDRALRVHLGSPIGDVCPDLSGRGNKATLVGPRNIVDGVLDRAVRFHGQSSGGGCKVIAADSDIANLDACTISMWLRTDSLGAASTGRIFEKANLWALYQNAAVIQLVVSYSDGLGFWNIPKPSYGKWHHLAITWASRTVGTVPPLAYIDGVAVNVTVVQARSGTLTDDSALALTFGNRSAYDRTHDGAIEGERVYASTLDAAAIRAEYLEGARRPLLVEPNHAHPISVAGVTASEVGPWERYSGTHKWTDNGVTRGLECTSAGVAVMPQPHAYGWWYWRATKAADGNTLDFDVILTEKGTIYSPATNDGYIVRMHSDESVYLWRGTNGAWAATIFTSAASYIAIGVEYEFLLTRRRSDSTFTLWIRGGAYTSWTQVGSGIDTTYTTSVWCAADIDTGDELRDLRHGLGEMTADEFSAFGLDVPLPRVA